MTARLRAAPLWLRETWRTARSDGTARYACTSLAMTTNRPLALMLGTRPIFYSRLLRLKAATVVGWGRRWSGERAAAVGITKGRPVLRVEDGFLRSVGRYDPALSHVFDQTGIYYDATAPSDLERAIATPLDPDQTSKAKDVIQNWQALGLSKYNGLRDYNGDLPDRYVLVVDQTFNDAAIRYGQADATSFQTMLQSALNRHPDHTIIIKTHPDVAGHMRKGHFNAIDLNNRAKVWVISAACHPTRLIAGADAVYTVTSQMGFEALLAGKPVHTFGMPFYAGWGLTIDDLPSPDRRLPASLEQLVHAALIRYPRYIDPIDEKISDIDATMAHVGLQRRHRTALPPRLLALGFSRWKRPFIRAFLQGSRVSFANRLPKAAAGHDALVLWGSKPAPDTDLPILRIEDGFLRSSGLGADLVRPLSLVIDDLGIYYDATRPSRLEQILGSLTLTPAQRTQARALRDMIVVRDITKYNLGHAEWQRPDTDKPVLLVVGQVETDASIRLGSPQVQRNIDLLKQVRRDNPDAYIIYKPHPDVQAGLRTQGQGEAAAQDLCDTILTSPLSIGQLLAGVDVVHVMTSLMGFEALLRGKPVVCHGLPFYAGWGLTTDMLDCARRTRALDLDGLIYGTLISYPRYFNYNANCFMSSDQAVAQLADLAAKGPGTRSWHRKLLRMVILGWLKLKGSKR